MKRLLDVTNTRETLGVSVPTLYRLMAQGELPFVKIAGRTLFRPSDVDELVERNVRRRGSTERSPDSCCRRFWGASVRATRRTREVRSR
jgi:excisionase family DNA binding protein